MNFYLVLLVKFHFWDDLPSSCDGKVVRKFFRTIMNRERYLYILLMEFAGSFTFQMLLKTSLLLFGNLIASD